MFAPWLKKSALKRKPSKNLLIQSSAPSVILLLSLVGVFILVGLFVMQQSYAAGMMFGGN